MFVSKCILQVLANAERSLYRSQSFQGGYCEVYKEENPLAGILTTAYGVRVTWCILIRTYVIMCMYTYCMIVGTLILIHPYLILVQKIMHLRYVLPHVCAIKWLPVFCISNYILVEFCKSQYILVRLNMKQDHAFSLTGTSFALEMFH